MSDRSTLEYNPPATGMKLERHPWQSGHLDLKWQQSQVFEKDNKEGSEWWRGVHYHVLMTATMQSTCPQLEFNRSHKAAASGLYTSAPVNHISGLFWLKSTHIKQMPIPL